MAHQNQHLASDPPLLSLDWSRLGPAHCAVLDVMSRGARSWQGLWIHYDPIRGIVLKGASFVELQSELIWLAGLMLLLIVVSSMRFQKKLDWKKGTVPFSRMPSAAVIAVA
jgi:hypothetical protein